MDSASIVILWFLLGWFFWIAIRDIYLSRDGRDSDEQAEIDAHNEHKIKLAGQAVLEHELGIWPHEEPEQAPVQKYVPGRPIKVYQLKECKACAAVKRGDICLCERCSPGIGKFLAN
jgi:hypothetical protein